jgi:hypothetical protein
VRPFDAVPQWVVDTAKRTFVARTYGFEARCKEQGTMAPDDGDLPAVRR